MNANDTIYNRPSETNNHSDIIMDVGKIIESDLKEVVDNFHDMSLKEELLRGIFENGFQKPLDIQQRALLPCIMGHDVIIQSPPGTGKTTSVLITILQQIDTSLNKCQALILAPTRDLALKIQKMVNVLGKFMKIYCHLCIGGTNIHNDMLELQTGSHVVVGTPGRVYDMMARNSLQPQFIKIFVLVEALKILSDNFDDKIKNVFKPLGDNTQVILLSNQVSTKVLDKSTYYTSNPIHILVQQEELILDAFNNVYINITKENYTNNRHPIVTKDYLGPLMDGGGTIQADWKEVVYNFDEMNLKEELLSSIYRCGFEKPLPIQQHAILPCIMGHDLIIQSPPGTGKTTSVLITILQQINTSLKECQALILTPTRKLAKMIETVVIAVGDFMKVDCQACVSRKNICNIKGKLDTFPHVVVGTSTCISDLIARNSLRTKFIKIFVLDEVNNMLNRGYKYTIEKVFMSLEKDIQVVFLSNLMSKNHLDVMPEITNFMKNPLRILLQKETLKLEAIKQFHVNITKENKTKNGHPTETKDHSGPLMDDSGKIASVCQEMVEKFDDMNLKEELLCGIYRYGLENPTPIQQRAILPCIMGHDVIIQSPPGTGKTTSILISIIQQIDTSLNECQALILTPTNKLANHIKKVVIAFSDSLKADCHACVGWKTPSNNLTSLKTLSHVVVGTPGRVFVLIANKSLRTKFIKIFVLDGASKLLTRGKKDQVQDVFNFLEEDTQVVLLSEAMTHYVLNASIYFVRNPIQVTVQEENKLMKTNKNVHIKITKKNDTNNIHPIETKDYSGPLIDDGGTIESDWKEGVNNFDEMNLKEELLGSIYGCGFEKPLPIQQHAILPCIMGHDLIIQSPPGTGKTTSILISIIQQIDTSLNECQALILTPTRKLALKIHKMFIILGEFNKTHCHVCIGSTNIRDDMRALQMGSHVVIGTPCCVYDIIVKNTLQTQFIKIFVLDEAFKHLSDEMINNKIKRVFKCLKEDTQVILLFNQMSMKVGMKVLDKSIHFMSNPIHILVQQGNLTLAAIKQFYVNNTKENNVKNGHPGDTNNYSGPSVPVDSGTIEYDCDEVVDNFHKMNLKEELLRGIFEFGFEKPLAIQQRAILPCIKGHDIIVQAQSGTGKTTSVLISILQQIDTNVNECQALILTPTFELARQIQNVVIALGKCMKANCHAYSGVKNFSDYIRKLDTVSHIVVGTHDYVSDLIARKYIRTKFIKLFVLDNANEHLSQPFKDNIKMVFKFLEKDIQVIFLFNEISENDLDFNDITHFLKNPVRIPPQKETLTLDAIKQFYINISKTKGGHHSETKDCLGSLVDDGETIESDWKEVVDNFHDMNLKGELLCSIYGCGFEKPSPIQQRAILPCIMGHDVIIQSPPGTGKTTSVLITILQQIDTSLNKCQALILAPTRDLALKIQKMVNVLGKFMKIYCHLCIGGTNIHKDMRELQTGSHVVVGTPGRVYDMIARNSLQPQFIKIFVLVEALKILSDNFDDKIKNVFKPLGDDTQVILLSNQVSTKVLDKSTYYTSNPIHILVQQD